MKPLLLSAIVLGLCLVVSCGGSPEPVAVAEPTVTPTSTSPPPTEIPIPADRTPQSTDTPTLKLTDTPVPTDTPMPTETPTKVPPTEKPVPPTVTPEPPTPTPEPTDMPPPTATPTEAPPPAPPEQKPFYEDGTYFDFTHWDEASHHKYDYAKLGSVQRLDFYMGEGIPDEGRYMIFIEPTTGVIGTGVFKGGDYVSFMAKLEEGREIRVNILCNGNGLLFSYAEHNPGKTPFTKFISDRYHPDAFLGRGKIAVSCPKSKCSNGRLLDDVTVLDSGTVFVFGGLQ